MKTLSQEWWRRWITGPNHYERPWLLFVFGIVILLYGFVGYLSDGSWLPALAGGVGAILLGVAEYLPTRWHAVAVALRIVFLLLLVVITVLLVARLLS